MRFGKPQLLLLLSTLLWSGSVLFAKISVQNGPPMHMAALRFTLSALVMGPALAAAGWLRRLSRAEWRDVALLGLLGIFLYNICFFLALFYTSAVEAALIMGASPVAHFAVAALAEGERLDRRKAAGILASVAGIALVVLGGQGLPGEARHRLLGDGLMFLGMFFWALNNLYGKRLGRRFPAAVTTGLPLLVAAAAFLAVTVPTGLAGTVGRLSLAGWGALAYLALASTIAGRQLWFAGLKGVDMTQAGVFFNLMPVWSGAWVALFLGERPGWLQVAGGALVLVGVFLITQPEAGACQPGRRAA